MCARSIFEASREIPVILTETFRRARAFVTAWLARPRIVADELCGAVDHHLRRVNAAQTKTVGIGTLAIAEETRRIGVSPAQVVPVIHVLTEHDQMSSRDRLGTIQLLQQRVRRRTTGATFGCKQLNQNRGRGIAARGIRLRPEHPAGKNNRQNKADTLIIPHPSSAPRSIARFRNGCANGAKSYTSSDLLPSLRASARSWAIITKFSSIMRALLSLGLLLSLCASAQTAGSKPPSPRSPASAFSVPRFKDVAREAGLTVSHISTPEKKYIVESMSGGAGLIDCDNDGKLDIITVNGSTIDRYRQGGDPMITLYHQDANFKFTNITSAAGLTRKGWGMGVAVADYDNDGSARHLRHRLRRECALPEPGQLQI